MPFLYKALTSHSRGFKESINTSSTHQGLECQECCLGAAFPCQGCPGDPSHAMSGTVTCSTGRESCLEIRDVGECDCTSLASSKVVENQGVHFLQRNAVVVGPFNSDAEHPRAPLSSARADWERAWGCFWHPAEVCSSDSLTNQWQEGEKLVKGKFPSA